MAVNDPDAALVEAVSLWLRSNPPPAQLAGIAEHAGQALDEFVDTSTTAGFWGVPFVALAVARAAIKNDVPLAPDACEQAALEGASRKAIATFLTSSNQGSGNQAASEGRASLQEALTEPCWSKGTLLPGIGRRCVPRPRYSLNTKSKIEGPSSS